MNLIKSTGTFSFFTLISRLTGYLRDILIAIFLGAGPIADAFFVAFRFPNTFRRLFSEGTFNAAFVPSYSSALNKGKKSAESFANNIFNILFLSLLAIVFIIEIFMPLFVALIAPGFKEDTEKLEIAINVSLSSFFSAILNSHNKFAAASATPIILNIILILVLLFGKYLSDQLVYYLSYAVTFAGLIQLIFLIFFVKKYFIPKISFKFKNNSKIKLFFKKLFPSIFSSGVTQINILVGTIIASFQANAVSYLYYADRIYQINLAIAGIAIGTVLLPSLSKYINSKNNTKIDFIQNKSLELSLFLSLPAAAALLIASVRVRSPNTVIAAKVAIAGSTQIGKNCMIGGQVAIAGHLKIGINVKIAGLSGVGSNLKDNAVVQGPFAFDKYEFQKSYIIFKKLPIIYKILEDIKKKLNIK